MRRCRRRASTRSRRSSPGYSSYCVNVWYDVLHAKCTYTNTYLWWSMVEDRIHTLANTHTHIHALTRKYTHAYDVAREMYIYTQASLLEYSMGSDTHTHTLTQLHARHAHMHKHMMLHLRWTYTQTHLY